MLKKNKNKIIILGMVVFIAIILIFSLSYCSKSKEEDKFVGIWYSENGYKRAEIVKNGIQYEWQSYNGKTKGVLYKDGFISEDGNLLFDLNNKFYGFEYKSKDEIVRITLYKPDVSSKPIDCEKKENWLLTRGKE